MRRLARLCFSATLCAVSGPALAANGGFMILGLQETQAPASTPADVQPVPYARARGTQRRPYWTAAERRRARAGSRLARDRARARRRARAAIPATGSGLYGAGSFGNDCRRHARQVPVSRRAPWKSAAIRHWRRAPRFRMGGRQADQPQVGVAGLDAAGPDAAPPSRSATSYGGRSR
jgi:hypothetical protein